MRSKEFITEGSTEYNMLRQLSKAADDKSTAASDELNKFPKGEMGLTPDSVKQDPVWQKLKKEFDKAFAEMRYYNGLINKNHKKEHRAAIAAERAARYKTKDPVTEVTRDEWMSMSDEERQAERDAEQMPSVKTFSVKEIAQKHDVPYGQISRELSMGTQVELEHTTNKLQAREIALDHLLELPDYYTRLAKMEHGK